MTPGDGGGALGDAHEGEEPLILRILSAAEDPGPTDRVRRPRRQGLDLTLPHLQEVGVESPRPALRVRLLCEHLAYPVLVGLNAA